MLHFILLDFHWTQLLQPQWYIENGGLWFVVFAVFAETGLFAGFFLPGDSLLFVTGMFSNDLTRKGLSFDSHSSFFEFIGTCCVDLGRRHHRQCSRILVWPKERTFSI